MDATKKNGPASEPTEQVRCSDSPTLRPVLTHHLSPPQIQDNDNKKTPPQKLGKSKKPNPKKQPVKWVDLFTCFHCGKEGRSPPLRRCSQCEIAYYCSKTCQKGHWKKHKDACIAAVAAKAEDARRERLATETKRKGKVKGNFHGSSRIFPTKIIRENVKAKSKVVRPHS